jgi:predicted glycogen debranching enzyme
MMTAAAFTSPVRFGREICGDVGAADAREWLVTNGIGGFACGTVSGALTRRYHGLLVAALAPPLGRTLLVTKLEESVHGAGETFALSSNHWAGGTVASEGFRQIESFRLEGTAPVWTFAFAGALLEKRIWMAQGENTTYVQYRLLRGGPVELELKVLVNYRDYHSTTHAGDWQMRVEGVEHGLRVSAFDGAAPFYLLSSSTSGEAAHDWYRNFDLPVERFRGLGDSEDHLHAATFRAHLSAGESVAIVCSTETAPLLDGDDAWRAQARHETALLERFAQANPAAAAAPEWVRQLVLASGQFVARRPLSDDADALTVIAGYPWFGDWGRDTMIALPGLALAAGRPEIARNILRTFARFTARGMLPNVFPDGGSTPEYNTVDAALWFFEAARRYYEATQDLALVAELFPVLQDIIEWHVRGTRHAIHVDPHDGLLYAGEPGVQLTWMDAKIGDWVVTPRIGKPVEINALWLNALATMREFCRVLNKTATAYEFMFRRAQASFPRFWNSAANCCFDVVDGPAGNDASLRPNQIFAVSLPESALTPEQQRAVVDACARHLVTTHGLRSLAPNHSDYRGRYAGSPRERDAVYHQGTVWGWLLGPFAEAHLRVYHDPQQAAGFLAPIADHLLAHGLGSVSEIFDGDAPHTPRGCFAQAWSVAEILRAWLVTAAPQEVKTPARFMNGATKSKTRDETAARSATAAASKAKGASR